jgi:tocopherol O-methyltransferase
MSDFYLSPGNTEDKNGWIGKWEKSWSIPGSATLESFGEILTGAGFKVKEQLDLTGEIYKSSRRMFKAGLLGAFPSEVYYLSHPKVSRFARKHYMSGYYQYKALKAGLWRYYVILTIK